MISTIFILIKSDKVKEFDESLQSRLFENILFLGFRQLFIDAKFFVKELLCIAAKECSGCQDNVGKVVGVLCNEGVVNNDYDKLLSQIKYYNKTAENKKKHFTEFIIYQYLSKYWNKSKWDTYNSFE